MASKLRQDPTDPALATIPSKTPDGFSVNYLGDQTKNDGSVFAVLAPPTGLIATTLEVFDFWVSSFLGAVKARTRH